MRLRRLVALLITSAALLPGLSPTVGHASGACPDGVFCAGASSADITPPVSTPMWGYTARQGQFEMSSTLSDAEKPFSKGDLAGAGTTIANDGFLHDKTSGDIEGYGKTFVHNHGIHLRLYANAFVLRGTNGAKVAVVQTDLGGLPGEVHQAVANRLASTGIDRDHLMIGATHTHQGPGGIFQYQGYALLGGDEFDPRVFEAVVSGITKAVLNADTRLEPAKLAIGEAPMTIDCERGNSGCASHNRRLYPQWCEDPENACEAVLDNKGNVVGHRWTGAGDPPSDPVTTVIRVDTSGGVPLGVITNFAAHGTVGGDDNLLFSGDNQGWATRLIERGIAEAYGQPLPPGHEIVDALINQAQGDQSPIGDAGPWDWGTTNREYAQMEDAGRRQVDPVVSEWQALGSQLRSDITVDARFEFLCFCGQRVDAPYVYDGPAVDKTDPLWDHIAPYASLGAADITLDEGTSSPVVFPAQGHKAPALGGAGTNPSITRLQVLRIADTLFAAVPGEPTITAGRRIKEALIALPGASSHYGRVVIAGLANDYDSYYATPEEYTAYQYEGSFTLFGPQSVPLLTEELARLASTMIAGEAVPDCTVPTGDFCSTHPVHPDTSAIAAPPTTTIPDPAPSVLGFDGSCTCARGQVQSFSWLGGSPTAEWEPGSDRVQLQFFDVDHWTTVAGDARDTSTVLRYDTAPQGRYRWTAQWDIPFDAPTGSYRFHILGHISAGAGGRTGYRIDSPAFGVGPAELGFSVTTTPATATVHVSYPGPYQLASFRYHPGPVTTGTVQLTVDHDGGDTETFELPADASGATTFALQPGDTVRGVYVDDAYGNYGFTQ